MALAPYFRFSRASPGARAFAVMDFVVLRFFRAAAAGFFFDRGFTGVSLTWIQGPYGERLYRMTRLVRAARSGSGNSSHRLGIKSRRCYATHHVGANFLYAALS